ncbi:unnamed protein product [Protopolystoma xenopodis]|uniref:Uncharacterized protein n=1 Tax=Protopolystoma xenopodis TaxID=117903 RepID=A0A3S5FFU3_9PLAT|nr:unnamed protein product [Protopolystoma xenopodis]
MLSRLICLSNRSRHIRPACGAMDGKRKVEVESKDNSVWKAVRPDRTRREREADCAMPCGLSRLTSCRFAVGQLYHFPGLRMHERRRIFSVPIVGLLKHV